MKNKIAESAKKMLISSVESTRFCFKYAPLKYTVYILVEIICSILPFAVLYNWENILNTLSEYGVVPQVYLMILFYIGITVLQSALNTLNLFIDKISYETIDNQIHTMQINKISSLDVGKFYDPKFQDAMSVVNDAPAYPYLFYDIINFAKSIIVTITAASGIMSRYPIATVVILILYIPSVIINCKNSVREYKFYRSMETDQRKSDYYRNVLIEKSTASELRLYGYEDLFRERYKKIWKQIYKAGLKLKFKETAWGIIGQLINPIGFIVLLIYIVSDIRSGSLAVGGVALYIGLGITFMNSVNEISSSFYTFHVNYMQCAGKFEAFLRLESALDESGTLIPQGIPEFEFRNVSFRYPGSERDVLKNISFKLKKGEKLAIVGVNGAGKTTITKLLCRFYDPTSGEILINGIPAKEYDINALRGMFGAAFQNSIVYTMTLRENIMLSDVRKNNEKDFETACEISGVSTLAQKLEFGYDSEIGRLWNGSGYEPSGGEKQKIGIARAFYKDAPAIILDEPSSALDAAAEDHIFTKFMELCRNKTAFLISHRLSAVSMADKIALIENGELIEFGTHDELMKAGKRYSELYNMQAQAYRETDSV